MRGRTRSAGEGRFSPPDPGPAILGPRLDFYDWRGRPAQLRWGQRQTRVSARPIVPGGPDTSTVAPAACGAPAASDVGERSGQLARAQLGRGPAIPTFEPPRVAYAWCAWFATNVWRQA